VNREGKDAEQGAKASAVSKAQGKQEQLSPKLAAIQMRLQLFEEQTAELYKRRDKLRDDKAAFNKKAKADKASFVANATKETKAFDEADEEQSKKEMEDLKQAKVKANLVEKNALNAAKKKRTETTKKSVAKSEKIVAGIPDKTVRKAERAMVSREAEIREQKDDLDETIDAAIEKWQGMLSNAKIAEFKASMDEHNTAKILNGRDIAQAGDEFEAHFNAEQELRLAKNRLTKLVINKQKAFDALQKEKVKLMIKSRTEQHELSQKTDVMRENLPMLIQKERQDEQTSKITIERTFGMAEEMANKRGMEAVSKMMVNEIEENKAKINRKTKALAKRAIASDKERVTKKERHAKFIVAQADEQDRISLRLTDVASQQLAVMTQKELLFQKQYSTDAGHEYAPPRKTFNIKEAKEKMKKMSEAKVTLRMNELSEKHQGEEIGKAAKEISFKAKSEVEEAQHEARVRIAKEEQLEKSEMKTAQEKAKSMEHLAVPGNVKAATENLQQHDANEINKAAGKLVKADEVNKETIEKAIPHLKDKLAQVEKADPPNPAEVNKTKVELKKDEAKLKKVDKELKTAVKEKNLASTEQATASGPAHLEAIEVKQARKDVAVRETQLRDLELKRSKTVEKLHSDGAEANERLRLKLNLAEDSVLRLENDLKKVAEASHSHLSSTSVVVIEGHRQLMSQTKDALDAAKYEVSKRKRDIRELDTETDRKTKHADMRAKQAIQFKTSQVERAAAVVRKLEQKLKIMHGVVLPVDV